MQRRLFQAQRLLRMAVNMPELDTLLLLLLQVSAALKRRLAERKDDTEQAVLLLRKLGEADDTLQVRQGDGGRSNSHHKSSRPECTRQLRRPSTMPQLRA
jgi:hypothetical protein